MIIALSSGLIAAIASSTRPWYVSRNVFPCFRKSSKKITRSSEKPQSPFASQTTTRSTRVSPRTGSTFSSCSSFSTKHSLASE